jgi:hypothetical protein
MSVGIGVVRALMGKETIINYCCGAAREREGVCV